MIALAINEVCHMEKKKYAHLSFEERFVIETLFRASVAIRSIAELLGRSPNTVSREIRENRVRGVYDAARAHHKAYVKRWRSKRQCMKVSLDPFLTRFVERTLREHWSPEQISGFLSREYGIRCSARAIYKWTRRRSLDHLLFWGWNRRRGGRKRYRYGTPEDGRRYIDERPPLPLEAGHCELDFIVSKQSPWVLLVAVDRVTRHARIARLPNRKHATVVAACSRMFSSGVNSLTLDNDIAFACWKRIEGILATRVYFTHPYHSWEKGLVENTNRWVRAFVPKKRDIGSVSEEELDDIHSFLNDRPRAVIAFRTPTAYHYELQSA